MNSLHIIQFILIIAAGWGIYRLACWVDDRSTRTDT